MLAASAAAAPAPAAAPEPAAIDAVRLVPVCVHAHFHACGLIDRAGNWIVEPRYHAIYENGEFWTVERDSGLVGLLAADGSERVAPRFDYIGPFVDGLAAATLPGPRDMLSGYIDASGQWVIEPKFLYTQPFNGATALAWLGPDYESRRLVLLRRDGRTTPVPETEEISAMDGRFVVRRGAEPQRSCAGLDADARVLVSHPGDCGLTIVRGAGWVRNGAAESGGRFESQVLDRRGRVLFRLTGADPWIAEPNREGLARFMPDESGEGLLDARTGRVLLPATARSTYYVGDGRISFGALQDGVTRFGYLDYRGRVVIPAQFEGVSEFADGVASVTMPKPLGVERESPSPALARVIDREGRSLPAFEKLRPESIDLTPWEDLPQSPVRRDVAAVTAGKRTWFTTLQGRVIAILESDADCGAQTLRNASGQIVWPRHPGESCAVRAGDRPEKTASPARLAAYRELQQHEASLQRERAAIDAQGGGVLNMLDPTRAARKAAVDSAAWVRGPATVELGRTVSFVVPAGYRYLSPAGLEALRARRVITQATPPGLGLLDAPEGRWQAFIGAVASGHVRLENSLGASEGLLQLLHARRFGLFAPRSDGKAGALINLQWEIEPVVDLTRRRLVFAFQYRNYENADSSRYLQVVKFGRAESVMAMIEFGGVLRMHDIDHYQDEILDAMEGVTFKQGERHEDVAGQTTRTEPGSIPLESFITGGPTPKETQFLDRLERETNPFSWENISKHLGKILGLVGLLLSAQLWRTRRGSGASS